MVGWIVTSIVEPTVGAIAVSFVGSTSTAGCIAESPVESSLRWRLRLASIAGFPLESVGVPIGVYVGVFYGV
eukprot:3799457-Lingulodinium_polyedra.AAC.1